MKHVRPYSSLAAVYDVVMAHVDYEAWADYLIHLVDMHHDSGANADLSVLELGAGTGLLTEELLAQAGWDMTVTDGSQDMLDAACARLDADASGIATQLLDFSGPWHCPDSRFDLVFLLYDGFNYLLDEPGVDALFKGVTAHLEEGGLFLFDQSTPHNSINNEAFFEDEGQEGQLRYRRTSEFDLEMGIHTTRFDIESPAGQFHEEHRQRAWTRMQVLALLEAHGLEVVASYDGFSLDPSHDESERIHWVVRRRA